MLKALFEEMIQTGKELVENKKEYEVMEINGEKYIHRMPMKINEVKYKSLEVGTVTGILDYIKSGADGGILSNNLFLQIISPTQIALLTEFNSDKERSILMKSIAHLPDLTLNNFIPLEEMIIMLQSRFTDTDDKDIVLKALSAVKMTDSVSIADDGVSQKLTIQKADELFDKMTLPSGVKLKPFRTFIEIEQPESLFILRLKEGQVALFEADGGLWKLDAIIELKIYLEKELNEHKNIKILA